MKKTLVAVAALAAVAGAHAQVTITGVMEAALSSSGGANTVIGGTNGGSEITFAVNEDLGSGLKAMAATSILHNLNDGVSTVANTAIGRNSSTTGSGPGSVSSYNSYIGLSGEFGSIKLGQQFSPSFFAGAVGDPGGRAAISNYLAGGATGQVANSITYSSPNVSGVTFSAQKALSTASTISAAEGLNYTGYSVTYANGGLTLAYAGAVNSTDGTTGSLKESVMGASYDFGVAKLYAGYSTISNAQSATGFGITAPVGAVTLLYGYSSQNTTNAQQFGASYNFTKRTRVYLAQGISGTSSTRTTVAGLRHDF